MTGGYRLVFPPELDMAKPRLEREFGCGYRNLTAGERNIARMSEWQRERRVRFSKFYVMGDTLIVPPWLKPEIERQAASCA